MHKFRVGDRVRIKSAFSKTTSYPNDIGTIVSIKKYKSLKIKFYSVEWPDKKEYLYISSYLTHVSQDTISELDDLLEELNHPLQINPNV